MNSYLKLQLLAAIPRGPSVLALLDRSTGHVDGQPAGSVGRYLPVDLMNRDAYARIIREHVEMGYAPPRHRANGDNGSDGRVVRRPDRRGRLRRVRVSEPTLRRRLEDAEFERVGLTDPDGQPLTRRTVERMTAERDDAAKRVWNRRLERLRSAGRAPKRVRVRRRWPVPPT